MAAGIEQVGDHPCSVQHLLEVVENQQEVSVPDERCHDRPERLIARFSDMEPVGYCRIHEIRVPDRVERDKGDPASEHVAKTCSRAEGEPRLTDPTRACQGKKRHIGTDQQRMDRRDLLLAANQGCTRPVPRDYRCLGVAGVGIQARKAGGAFRRRSGGHDGPRRTERERSPFPSSRTISD